MPSSFGDDEDENGNDDNDDYSGGDDNDNNGDDYCDAVMMVVMVTLSLSEYAQSLRPLATSSSSRASGDRSPEICIVNTLHFYSMEERKTLKLR